MECSVFCVLCSALSCVKKLARGGGWSQRPGMARCLTRGHEEGVSVVCSVCGDTEPAALLS